MGIYRLAKSRSYSAQPAAGGGGGEGAYRLDGLTAIPMFYVNTAISNGVANTAIQDVFVCPQRLVLTKLAIIYNTGGFYQSGTDKWNIVVGSGAENGASGTAQALAVAGNSVFAADKAFAGGAVSTNYVIDGTAAVPIVVDVPETWYDAYTLLSFRVVTGATVGVHFAVTSGFAIQVFGLTATVDAFPNIGTANPNTDF